VYRVVGCGVEKWFELELRAVPDLRDVVILLASEFCGSVQHTVLIHDQCAVRIGAVAGSAPGIKVEPVQNSLGPIRGSWRRRRQLVNDSVIRPPTPDRGSSVEGAAFIHDETGIRAAAVHAPCKGIKYVQGQFGLPGSGRGELEHRSVIVVAAAR